MKKEKKGKEKRKRDRRREDRRKERKDRYLGVERRNGGRREKENRSEVSSEEGDQGWSSIEIEET